jgi:HSP20 family protein
MESMFPWTTKSLEGGKWEEFFPVRVNLSEGDTAYRLTAEIPGVNKKDIEITVENDMLTISGEKKMAKEDTEGDYHRLERSYGSFYRQMTLPKNADKDAIEADVKDGVLTVTIQKQKGTVTERQKIAIK